MRKTGNEFSGLLRGWWKPLSLKAREDSVVGPLGRLLINPGIGKRVPYLLSGCRHAGGSSSFIALRHVGGNGR